MFQMNQQTGNSARTNGAHDDDADRILRPVVEEVCYRSADAAHDLAHVERVVRNTRDLARCEGADLEVLVPAAWLHDIVTVPKSSPDRSRASLFSADRAIEILRELGWPDRCFAAIHHAIVAHSFSAAVEPRTKEAAVLQDADRLDAIGAIGIARCFALGGELRRPIYHPDDPFCENGPARDDRSSLDHFFTKLLVLERQLKTESGRKEGARRTEVLRNFISELRREIIPDADRDRAGRDE